MTWRESLAPLRERNFRFYFASRFVNTAGNASAASHDIFASLEKLAALQSRGIVSEQEYASKKAELLSRL